MDPVTTSRSYHATDSVRDQRIERLEPLLAPIHLLEALPLTDANSRTVLDGRARVHAVLSGRLPFLGIPAVIEETLQRLGSTPIRAFETLYEADRDARAVAGGLLSAHA